MTPPIQIKAAQEMILEAYRTIHAHVSALPPREVDELRHRAEELRQSPQFSLRTAAEITHTACVMTQEKR